MSEANKQPDDQPAPEMRTIRALSNLDVDGVRIAEGSVASVRAELVDRLVELGAAEDAPAGAAAGGERRRARREG